MGKQNLLSKGPSWEKSFVIQEYKHKYFINLKAIKYLPNI